MSVGSDDKLCGQAEQLQSNLRDKCGIILWEDVLRRMYETEFKCADLPVTEWREYGAALDTDAKWE